MSIADKLTAIAENEQKVYEAGKKAEYDEFWDAFQNYGNRRTMNYMFSGNYWTNRTFKPKYHMKPINANNMFQDSTLRVDLVEILHECGVELDTSDSTSMSYMFGNSQFTRVGVIDISKYIESNLIFSSAVYLRTIVKLIVTEKNKYSSVFNKCSALENLTIEGTIGQSGFSVSPCTKLTKASITSIINALSQTTSGIAVTLSKTAVNKAFETSEGANDGSTSQEWSALEATKTNWTISLA